MSLPAAAPPPQQPRPDNVRALRLRPRYGQWPATVVLVATVVSFAVVASGHFRRGAVIFSGAVVLAFFLRLLLPSRDAGWLAVRHRAVDLVVLGMLGAAVASLTFLVPPPS